MKNKTIGLFESSPCNGDSTPVGAAAETNTLVHLAAPPFVEMSTTRVLSCVDTSHATQLLVVKANVQLNSELHKKDPTLKTCPQSITHFEKSHF